MGNCISCIKKKPSRSITVAMLGLDSAGKTTTTKALLGEDLETAPTIGFCKEEFVFKNYNITLYDLGGGRKIRDIWKDYLCEVYGVIYVVDSSAPERFSEVKESITSVLQHEKVKGKPILVLANKEDIAQHVDEVEIMEQLKLEDLVNQNKCPCKLEMCSAIKGTGRKMDRKIKIGMKWLCSLLDQLYDKLKERVDADVSEMRMREQKEKEERKERVRKIREERARKEEEERKKLGIEKPVEEEEEDDFVDGDPFKRLDSEEVRRKEEKYKQDKAKEKEKQRRLKEIEENTPNNYEHEFNNKNVLSNGTTHDSHDRNNVDDDDDGVLRAPRSSRALFGLGWMNSALTTDQGESNSQRSARQILPPLEGLSNGKSTDVTPRSTGNEKKKNKKLKNKVQSYNTAEDINEINGIENFVSSSSVSRIQVESVNHLEDDNNDSDSVIQSSGRRDLFRKSRGLYIDDSDGAVEPNENEQKSKRKKKKSAITLEGEVGFDTLRLSQRIEPEDEGMTYSSRRKNSSPKPQILMNGVDEEERSLTPVKKLKKKNKHLRKNKLAPSDEEFELTDVESTPKKQPLQPWVRSPSPRKMLDDGDSHTNWGMAEDISPANGVHQFRRSRPNFDSEDDLIL